MSTFPTGGNRGDGTSGQDRESYTDDQDRESYTVHMTREEALDILDSVCQCTDPMCPDSVHWGLVQQARACIEELDADAEYERMREDALFDGPPEGWEP